jgi:hypothetical protein
MNREMAAAIADLPGKREGKAWQRPSGRGRLRTSSTGLWCESCPWIEELAAQTHPGTRVELSQAGRRATILARLWGSRAAMAKDLLALNDFLRAFKSAGSSDSEAYPQGDGVRLTPAEGLSDVRCRCPYSHGGEARRDPRASEQAAADKRIQRGLIVPCSECERRAFYWMDALKEKNTCPRCGAVRCGRLRLRSQKNKHRGDRGTGVVLRPAWRRPRVPRAGRRRSGPRRLDPRNQRSHLRGHRRARLPLSARRRKILTRSTSLLGRRARGDW